MSNRGVQDIHLPILEWTKRAIKVRMPGEDDAPESDLPPNGPYPICVQTKDNEAWLHSG